jgi:hypothetical protein
MAFLFKHVRLATILWWLVMITFVLPPPLGANGQARLYLQAVPLQDEKLLVVEVHLADVADLYGVEVKLRYDPTQLEAQDAYPHLEGVQIFPGPFLAAEKHFVVTNVVDTESGLIHFAVTLLNPAPPASGEGVLATIAFGVAGGGPFSVEVVKAQLVSPGLDTLPVTTEDLRLNGEAWPAWPSGGGLEEPASNTRQVPPWGWWSVALLGAFMVLVFLVLPRLKGMVAVTPNAPGASHRRMPGAAFLSSRSLALLTQEGKQAMSRGDAQKAYELFSQAVELDPANAEAWLGKGLVARHEIEKRICFQRVLALDPDNTVAKGELQRLEEM